MVRHSRSGVQLSDSDLRFVVQAVATQRQDHDRVVEIVRDKPDILEHMLEDEALFRKVAEDGDALVKISPWLLFIILIRRAARDVSAERYTVERMGVTGRVPVFDTERVAALLRNPDLRDYLADMLASFVRTESTTVWYRSGRFIRRRTYSDMDVDDMIGLASQVDPEQRFPFYKRIGDICLFMAGIFPEHLLAGYAPGRGLQGVSVRGRRRRSLPDLVVEGQRFYGLAAAHKQSHQTGLHGVLSTLSESFDIARKPLSLISDRYIRVHKVRLFGQAD